jgi:hypothetical protein
MLRRVITVYTPMAGVLVPLRAPARAVMPLMTCAQPSLRLREGRQRSL